MKKRLLRFEVVNAMIWMVGVIENGCSRWCLDATYAELDSEHELRGKSDISVGILENLRCLG